MSRIMTKEWSFHRYLIRGKQASASFFTGLRSHKYVFSRSCCGCHLLFRNFLHSWLVRALSLEVDDDDHYFIQGVRWRLIHNALAYPIAMRWWIRGGGDFLLLDNDKKAKSFFFFAHYYKRAIIKKNVEWLSSEKKEVDISELAI